VLRLERLVAVAECDPRFAAGDVLERQVGGVATVRELDDVFGGGLDSVKQRIDGHALPDSVELRPLGHAVDVDGHLLAGQSLELLPRPAARLVHLADDREVPLLERRCGVGPAERTGKSLVT
jgi:hypothetical protein